MKGGTKAVYLGCPAWSVREWRGTFLPEGTPSRDFLPLYSKVFRSVEANSTFYSLPTREVAERWAREVRRGFRFCFKVPRQITHEGTLHADGAAREEFLDFLAIFAEEQVLGATFLQVHDSFGPKRLSELAAFLERWPRVFPLAVEVRHCSFFEGNREEEELNGMLREAGAGRVLFDSRALYHAPADDPVEAVSQTRKPRLPVRWETMRDQPVTFLRFVGRNRIAQADPWLAEVAREAAGWMRRGSEPYLFMHAPDDGMAPALCGRFHAALRKELPEVEDLDLDGAKDQLELF